MIIVTICMLLLLLTIVFIFIYRLRFIQKESHRKGILSVEHVKDTSLPILIENFNTESTEQIVNCTYKNINSVPGNIVLSTKMKGGYLDEMTNEMVDGVFTKNLAFDKKRHKQLINNEIYHYENNDKFFKEKIGFYLNQKFDKILKSIVDLREFKVKDLYITKLLQPDMRTSRSFYLNFDALIYRDEKNHGKHLKCLGEIVDIRSLSKLNFKLILYSVKVIGVVTEDKFVFDDFTDPYNTNTYTFV